MNGTSNEYDLQSVYNANSFLGIVTELSQVYLAIYDAHINPFSYTDSGNIGITDNKTSLNFLIKINDKVVLHPRNYEGAVFDMVCGTDSFAFRQNTIHGGAPTTQFHSSTEACTFHGGCSIQNSYDESFIDDLISNVFIDVYMKT